MSRYIESIGNALAEVLDRCARSRTEQFAGYCANLEFWISECEHLRGLIEGFDRRFEIMKSASDRYQTQLSHDTSRDDCGVPYQSVKRTTSNGDRERVYGSVKSSMSKILRRAYDLELIDLDDFDRFSDRVPPIDTGAYQGSAGNPLPAE